MKHFAFTPIVASLLLLLQVVPKIATLQVVPAH